MTRAESEPSELSSNTGCVAFESTAWSVVADAQGADPATSGRCLALLVGRYWRPVFAFIRRRGRSYADAQDLAQGFFTEFLEKDIVSYADQARGRFRTFLLASVKRYLALGHRRESRRPSLFSAADLDRFAADPLVSGASGGDPERVFMKSWVKCLLANSIARFRQECEALGKAGLYRVFEARYLVDPERFRSYREIAADVGKSEVEVGKMLQSARARVARAIRREAGNVVARSADADAEIDEIMSFLAC